MSVNSINGTSSAGSGSSTSATASSGSQTVSTKDFMQLLSTEMSNQDPLQPMDPSQTMTQLAQFTTLQQMTQMSQSQSVLAATALLGSDATVKGTNSQSVTGAVSSIDTSGVSSGSLPSVLLGTSSTEYPITSITHLQQPASSSTSNSSSTPGA